MTFAKQWWFDEQGRNNLSGVPGDLSNPPILPDHIIVEFLLTIPAARDNFRVLVPLMLPAEQERLNGLVARNPRTMKNYAIDDQILDDRFMRAQDQGVHHDPNRKRR